MNNQELNYWIKELNMVSYPELINVRPNYSFGRMVYDSYAGSKGELTTILTYIYQILTNNDKEDLSMLMGMIAKQEMTHLKLLGEILVKMDLKPYFMSTYGNKWCSDNVKTEFSCIDDMLNFNIKSEMEAIEEYRSLMNNCNCESINNVLNRIIMDEQNHIEIFKMLKNNYGNCN